jgi:hypothetical protein
LAFINKVSHGQSVYAALTATYTIVTFCCGAAAAAVVWLLARWLDGVEPSPYSLDDLIEMMEESKKPSHQYLMRWVKQLSDGLTASIQLLDSEPMPVPKGYESEDVPLFDSVLATLRKMNEIDGDHFGGAGMLIEGADKTLLWEINGDNPKRCVHLHLENGPIEDHVGESNHRSESGLPILRLRSSDAKRDNPHNHGAERLSELNRSAGNVRGRFWHTFLVFILLMPIFPALLVGLYWYLSPDTDKTAKAVALSILSAGLVVISAFILSLCSLLTRIEVSDGRMRFIFAGLTRKEIPLAAINGYETTLGGRRAITIRYGRRWHCPSSLVDHRKVADLLDSFGLHRID